MFLNKSIIETKTLDLSNVWNISSTLSDNISVTDKNRNINFLDSGNKIICKYLKITSSELDDLLLVSRTSIVNRGESEIVFWENKITEIEKYTHEQAIKELVIALKLKEKISTIKKYIDSLRRVI